jgi:hypothetical protein
MTSPFELSLVAFDAAVTLSELCQIRSPQPDGTNFVVFFRHTPSNRVLAYELMTNIWSDVTGLRDWGPPLSVPRLPPNFHMSAIR